MNSKLHSDAWGHLRCMEASFPKTRMLSLNLSVPVNNQIQDSKSTAFANENNPSSLTRRRPHLTRTCVRTHATVTEEGKKDDSAVQHECDAMFKPFRARLLRLYCCSPSSSPHLSNASQSWDVKALAMCRVVQSRVTTHTHPHTHTHTRARSLVLYDSSGVRPHRQKSWLQKTGEKTSSETCCLTFFLGTSLLSNLILANFDIQIQKNSLVLCPAYVGSS